MQQRAAYNRRETKSPLHLEANSASRMERRQRQAPSAGLQVPTGPLFTCIFPPKLHFDFS